MTLSTKFADQGTRVGVITFDDDTIKDKLKPAVYSVGFDMMAGYYLNKVGDKLNTPTKVYGNVSKRVEKILTSYEAANSSFGVLMSGDKGSGKTMTSSIVANHAIEQFNLPVILVEGSFDAESLASFIKKIGECVLFFDEFGKRFKDESGDQSELLGLMDGTGSTKRLVMLTENEKHDINRYMLNRPGRIHYHFEYGKLDEDTITELCAEHNIPEEVVSKILLRREMSYEFSFDVLQALVYEYKLYGGDVDELAKDLNIETTHKVRADSMMILSAVEQETGEEVETREIHHNWPKVGRNTYVALAGEEEAATKDSDDIFDLAEEPKYAKFFSVGMKDLVHKEKDIYTFVSKGNDGKSYIVKVLKEHANAGNGYAV